MTLYQNKIDRNPSGLDENERIQGAYEKMLLSEARRGKVKKIPWRKLKKMIKSLKRFKRKKAKKTKDAFDFKFFKKKGKTIKDKMRKMLKRIIREEAEVEYEDRIIALAQHLDIDINDEEEMEDIEQSSYGGYEAEGGEYEVLTDSEADERAKDYILDSVWAFTTWFLENHIDVEDVNGYYGFEDSYYDEDEEEEIEIGDADEVFYMGMGMDLTEWIESKQNEAEGGNDDLAAHINDKDFVDDAISTDGRGHFLSSYDGEEHEETVNGRYYFIYRTN